MNDETILFFVEPMEPKGELPAGARDGRDIGPQFGDQRRELVTRLQEQVAVPVERLRRQVGQLVGLVAEVFDQAKRQVAKQPERLLQLEEVELTVEVNAEGQLGILGNGGKAGGKGGIKQKPTSLQETKSSSLVTFEDFEFKTQKVSASAATSPLLFATAMVVFGLCVVCLREDFYPPAPNPGGADPKNVSKPPVLGFGGKQDL